MAQNGLTDGWTEALLQLRDLYDAGYSDNEIINTFKKLFVLKGASGNPDLDALRAESAKAMTSALWEYCPSEFHDLIEEVERLRNRERDLIRYNSEQVVLRRVSDARLRLALETLQIARNIFREYERLHRAKGTEDADRKAQRNDEAADLMDAAMSFDPDPDDYGKP